MSTTIRVDVTRAETRLTVALSVLDCASCGVVYAMPDEFDTRRREDHKSFYCPNGHSQSYTGETKAERLQRELNATKRSLESAKADAAFYRETTATTERSLAATKGVVTKMRKRAIAGACQFCHRPFANVARHVASKHPDQVAEA